MCSVCVADDSYGSPMHNSYKLRFQDSYRFVHSMQWRNVLKSNSNKQDNGVQTKECFYDDMKKCGANMTKIEGVLVGYCFYVYICIEI